MKKVSAILYCRAMESFDADLVLIFVVTKLPNIKPDVDSHGTLNDVETAPVDELDENPEVDKTFLMSHAGQGLRFRLTATDGHDLVSRNDGDQSCSKSCCISHCLVYGHGKDTATADVQFDRSWVDPDKFEMELVDMSIENDPFMSMICAVNTDLSGGDNEVPPVPTLMRIPCSLQCPGFDKTLLGLCPGLSSR